jgi:agmatinase
MPGVAGRTPGGLTYQQAIGLIEGVNAVWGDPE